MNPHTHLPKELLAILAAGKGSVFSKSVTPDMSAMLQRKVICPGIFGQHKMALMGEKDRQTGAGRGLGWTWEEFGRDG